MKKYILSFYAKRQDHEWCREFYELFLFDDEVRSLFTMGFLEKWNWIFTKLKTANQIVGYIQYPKEINVVQNLYGTYHDQIFDVQYTDPFLEKYVE